MEKLEVLSLIFLLHQFYTSRTNSMDQAVGQVSGHASQSDDEVERSFFRWLSFCLNDYLNAKEILL